jgi:hypothetical protein
VKALCGRSGAYVIRHAKTKECLYVGESHTGNLSKTLKRHFWTWNDTPDRKHAVYRASSVEVAIRITPPNSAVGAQNNLNLRLNPRDSRPVADDPDWDS